MDLNVDVYGTCWNVDVYGTCWNGVAVYSDEVLDVYKRYETEDYWSENSSYTDNFVSVYKSDVGSEVKWCDKPHYVDSYIEVYSTAAGVNETHEASLKKSCDILSNPIDVCNDGETHESRCAERNENPVLVEENFNVTCVGRIGKNERVYRKCAYKGCVNTNLSSKLFTFPKVLSIKNGESICNEANLKRCSEWVALSGNEKLIAIDPSKLNGKYYVCMNHFEKKYFMNVNRLTPDAIPSPNEISLEDLQIDCFTKECSVGESTSGVSSDRDSNLILRFQEDMKSLIWYTCDQCRERVLRRVSDKKKCAHGKRCIQFSAVNNMDPGEVPDALKCLTFVEEQLISLVHPLIAVFKLKGLQFGYSGNIISFPQNVSEFASVLPHKIKNLESVITVRYDQGKVKSHDFRVRANKVLDALLWLKSNNKYYFNVVISMENVNELPSDGNVFDEVQHVSVSTSNKGESNSHDKKSAEINSTSFERDESNASKSNLVSDDLEEGDCVMDDDYCEVENVELNDSEDRQGIHSSGVPSTVMPHPNEQINAALNWPTIGTVAINEFKTPGYMVCAFPTLFPTGSGDFNEHRSKSVSISMYFKHLINYHDQRFAKHKTFRYFAFNTWMRWCALNDGSIFVRNNADFQNMSIYDLKENIQKNPNIIKKIMFQGSNLRGTKSYWHSRCQELRDMVEQIGLPTVFLTLSFADMHCPDLYRLLCNDDIESITEKSRRELVQDNPAVLDLFFLERFESFLKHVLIPKFHIVDYWFRIEYQHRGSPHMHGVFWFQNAPKIEKLVSVSDEVKLDIRSYFDNIITAENPRINCSAPEVHPCRKLFQSDCDQDEDLGQLLKMVQRHSKCSEAYCLKYNKTEKRVMCRFKFPFALQEESSLETNNSGYLEFMPKRNDSLLNKFNKIVCQGWRANSDIAAVVAKEALITYLAKYISKADIKSLGLEELLTLAMNICDTSDSVKKCIQRLLIKSCAERDYSAQEVSHILLGLKLYSSGGRKFVSINLSESKDWIPVENGSSEHETGKRKIGRSSIIKYMERPTVVDNLTLYEAALHYDMSSWKRLKRENIVRVFPKIYNKTEESEMFFRQQVLLHVAWRNEKEFPSTGLSWKEIYENYKLSDKRTAIDLDEDVEDNLCDFEDDNCENEDISTEEWMVLSSIGPNHEVPVVELGRRCVDLEYDWYASFTNYLDYGSIDEFLGFIDKCKKSSCSSCVEDIQVPNVCLNDEQKYVWDLLNTQISNILNDYNDPSVPKRVIIQGKAGTGKSLLIKCLIGTLCSTLGNKSFVVVGPTGVSALALNGKTIHCAFGIPTNVNQFKSLTGSRAREITDFFESVQFLIVDEYSMVGSQMMGMVDNRCREAKGNLNEEFGGLNVFLFGDIKQLPPVMDTPLYSNSQKTDLAIHGKVVFNTFQSSAILTHSHRQQDIKFVEILDRLSTGDSTLEDYQVLSTRFTNNVPASELKKFENAIHLFATRAEVEQYNMVMLQKLINKETGLLCPVARICAKHNCSAAAKSSSEDAEGLEPVLYLAKGAKVMLRSNLWVDKGSVNGSVGTVVDIIYDVNDVGSEMFPKIILCEFPTYTGPKLIPETCIVPITAILKSWTDRKATKCTRLQFPLMLCYACSIHKSQGMTLELVVIDIGIKEFSLGLAYVAFSRAKKLSGILIQPFDFQRIGNLKRNSGMILRNEFEDRLKDMKCQ